MKEQVRRRCEVLLNECETLPSTDSPVTQFSVSTWKALDWTMPAAYMNASKLQDEGGHRLGRCSRIGRTRLSYSSAVLVRPVSAMEVPARPVACFC